MALPRREQIRYWSIAAAVLAIVLWFLGDVILPFVLGGAFAYCLDPIADRLEKMGLSRLASVIVITIIATLVLFLATLLIVPQLISQAIALVRAAPETIATFEAFLTSRFQALSDESSTVRQALTRIGETIEGKGTDLINSILGSAMSLVSVTVLLILVPVVTFYLLLDWDRMVAKIDDLLPRDHAPIVRQIFADINKTLAAFIRGQGTVCLILGIYYAVALILAGLNFGLVVGLGAGLISFIPYIGALFGGIASIGLALFQFWGEWHMVAIIAAIFFAGQTIEGNILTPNLVGGSVGLHPVWLLFALSVFGSLFGFVGMLVAVPLAASLGVVARFLIGEYRDSRLYQGLDYVEPDADQASSDDTTTDL
ncbi:MAG: AI-2E family transporter [Pseudomonadota bacterium]